MGGSWGGVVPVRAVLAVAKDGADEVEVLVLLVGKGLRVAIL